MRRAPRPPPRALPVDPKHCSLRRTGRSRARLYVPPAAPRSAIRDHRPVRSRLMQGRRALPIAPNRPPFEGPEQLYVPPAAPCAAIRGHRPVRSRLMQGAASCGEPAAEPSPRSRQRRLAPRSVATVPRALADAGQCQPNRPFEARITQPIDSTSWASRIRRSLAKAASVGWSVHQPQRARGPRTVLSKQRGFCSRLRLPLKAAATGFTNPQKLL